jgi:hypothetical protein
LVSHCYSFRGRAARTRRKGSQVSECSEWQ